jgi:hypothetical protein
MGWQGMATCGQFLTLVGIVFFFATLLLSHLDRRVSLLSSLGVVRWQKRAHYYLYKIKWNQYNEELASFLPSADERILIRENYFSEYEVFRVVHTN